MTAPPPAEADLDDPGEIRSRERIAMLRELAEIGMDFAREMRRRALDEAPAQEASGEEIGKMGMALTRVARAVRLTLALEARFDGEVLERTQARRSALAEERSDRALRRRSRVENAVTAAINVPGRPFREAERLYEALEDWMEAEDDELFLARPLGEIITRIGHDLGVPIDLGPWGLADRTFEKSDPPGALQTARGLRPPGKAPPRSAPPPLKANGAGKTGPP